MILLFALIILGLFIYMTYEARGYGVSQHQVKIRKPLKRALRILHLSDTHFSGRDYGLSRFFDRLAKETYDFIFVTGDIMDSEEGIDTCIENFSKLQAKGGFFAVFGNHDYFDYKMEDMFLHNFPGQVKPKRHQPSDLLKDRLEGSGVQVLKNEVRLVSWEGDNIAIHGIDDPTTGKANIREALGTYDPNAINILLSHTIDVFWNIGRNEMDMAFSGHSHGGQVRLPFFGPILTHTTLGRPYVSGVRNLKGGLCSISRGVGTSRYLRLRFLCPPEAIVLKTTGIRHGKS